jgi:GNAT superfamily N-acetyltransferase
MIISDQLGEPMKKRIRPTFSPEFRLEASQLVVDQNYTVIGAAKARNMGYGTKLLNGMLGWAMTNGATKAYLQVVVDNQPAINLYKKLGYQPCYEYWYRIGSRANKPMHATSG